MASDKTPPTGTPAINPPRPLPTLATLQASVDAALRELRGARLDIDQLKTSNKAIREQLTETEEIIRISRIPRPGSLSPIPTEPRPSMAVKAAKGTSKAGKILMIGTGVLTVAGQVVSFWRPEFQGPIIQALKLLASLGGADQ